MGQGDSKELRGVLSQVGGLNKDASEWRAVLMQFVSLPFEEGERIASKKADIKLYNALLKLLNTEDLLTNMQDYTNVFEAFSRILTSRQLLKELTKKGDLAALLKAIEVADPRVLPVALKVILTLIHNCIEKPKDDAEIEAENKANFAENGGFELVIRFLCKFSSGPSGTNASDEDAERIVRIALQILRSIAIEHRFSTTFDDNLKLVELIYKHNAEFFDLLHHQNAEVRVLTANLVKYCMLESNIARYRQLQNLGLESGVLIRQVSFSIAENSREKWASDQREASRELVGLFCDNNARNINVVRQMLPEPVCGWAEIPPCKPYDQVPLMSANDIKAMIKSEGERRPKYTKFTKQQKKLFILATRFHAFREAGWSKMFTQMEQDWAVPTLIWNNETRLELKEKLAAEIAEIQRLSALLKNRVEWDAEDFHIHYSCLDKELKAGPYYVHLLVQELDKNHDFKVYDPVPFMKDLYNCSVIEDNNERKRMILLAMRKVFARYSSEFNGEFEHLPYLVWLLSPHHCEIEWKEELLLLLKKLFSNPVNIKKFIALGGLPAVINHLCLSHKVEYQKSPSELSDANREGTSDIVSSEGEEASQEVRPPIQDQMANRHLIAINILALLEAICIFPRSRKELASGDNFQYIVQTLLTDEINVANQVVILLSQIIDSNPFIHPYLYKTGVFIFLMRLLRGGCSDKVSSFLRTYHKLQAAGSEDENHPSSYLEYFLPSPLISVLNKETGVENFTQAMNSDVMKQDLYWNAKFREHLADCAESQLADFIALLRTNPESIYEYRTPEKVVYEDLERELCVGNIYLRFFVQDPQPLTENQDPEALLSELVASMDSELFSNTENALFILQSQIELFKMYSEKPRFINYPGMDRLIALLASHNDLSQENSLVRLSRVVELLVTIFRSPNPSNSTSNIAMFTSHPTSFDILLSIILTLLQAEVHSSVGTIVMENVLRVLSVLSVTAGMKSYVASKPDMLFCLRKLVSRKQLQHSLSTCTLTLKCIQELCASEELHPQIVSSGMLFSLLDLAVLYPLQLDGGSQRPQAVTEGRICLQAVTILASIAASSSARPVLRKCLTINLYYRLASKTQNDVFLTLVRSNVEDPLTIWNEHTRHELTELLDHFGVYHIRDASATPTVFDPTTFEFSFRCLADEIVVNNLYVRVFNEQPSFAITNPNPETFLSKLLASLREDTSYLFEVKRTSGDLGGFSEKDGAILQALQNSVSVKLTAVLNLLKYHNVTSFMSRDENNTAFTDLFNTAVVLPEKGSIALLLQIVKLLAKNAQSSSCVLSVLKAVHRLLVFKPTFVRSQVQQILETLSEASLVNSAFSKRSVDSGLILHILLLMATSEDNDERIEAARTLGALVSPVFESKRTSQSAQINNTESTLAMTVLKQLLSPLFRPYLENGYAKPEELIQFFDEDHDTPLIIWNREIRKDLVSFLSREILPIEESLNENAIIQRAEFQWNTARLQSYDHPSLAQELRICDVFVRNYSENPFFKLDNPDLFLKSLLRNITQAFGQYKVVLTSGASGGEHSAMILRNLLLMWGAVRCVCENNPKVQPQFTEAANIALLFDHLNSMFISYIDQDLIGKVLEVLLLLVKNEMFVKSLLAANSLAGLLQLTGSNTKLTLSVLAIIGDIVIRDHDAVMQFRMAGGVLYLLRTLLQRRERSLRVAAAEIMCKLTADSTHGVQMSEYLCTFLTPKFASKFEQRADKFLEFFDSDHESDWKKWNENTRDTLSLFCERHVKLLDRSAENWNGSAERFNTALLVEVYPEPIKEPEPEPEPETQQEPQPEATFNVQPVTNNDNFNISSTDEEPNQPPPLFRLPSFHPENVPLPQEDEQFDSSF